MVTLAEVHCQTLEEVNFSDNPHPRILLKDREVELLKTTLNTDKYWNSLHALVISEAENIINEKEPDIIKSDGTIVNNSREVLRRILFLGYAYRVMGDMKFKKKAVAELMNICRLKNWNPKISLDMAEMTMAAAIGYDWFYHDLTASEKDRLVESIYQKGIQASYDERYNGFEKLHNNWSQVINAALCIGAVAIFEKYPEEAKKTVQRALALSQNALGEYCPDGVYPEGYMYWIYGTSYSAMMYSVLESLGLNIDDILNSCLLKSGLFYLNMIGPSGHAFNWSDVFNVSSLNPAIFWIANKTSDYSLLWNEKQLIQNGQFNGLSKYRLLPVTLLMGASQRINEIPKPQNKMWLGRGENSMAVMRSSWDEKEAIYLGFKLGNPREHHSHLDMGSFVMEALGERWAIDMPMQNYHANVFKGVKIWDNRQDGGRWQLLCTNNFGHSTLTMDRDLMDVKGETTLLRSGDQDHFQFAIGDLSNIFLRRDRQVVRGVGIKEEAYVIIRDEISDSPRSLVVTWQMVTTADVDIISEGAMLTQNGKKLKLKVASPEKVAVKVIPAHLKSPHGTVKKNIKIVYFELEIPKNQSAAIQVFLVPQQALYTEKLESIPLKDW